MMWIERLLQLSVLRRTMERHYGNMDDYELRDIVLARFGEDGSELPIEGIMAHLGSLIGKPGRPADINTERAFALADTLRQQFPGNTAFHRWLDAWRGTAEQNNLEHQERERFRASQTEKSRKGVQSQERAEVSDLKKRYVAIAATVQREYPNAKAPQRRDEFNTLCAKERLARPTDKARWKYFNAAKNLTAPTSPSEATEATSPQSRTN
jgi:hypothetical protein